MAETKGITNIHRRMAALALGKNEALVTDSDERYTKTAVWQTGYADEPDLEALLAHFKEVPAQNLAELRELLYCILRKDLTEVGAHFQHGVYRHFKGGLYRTLMTVKDAGTKANLIVYSSLKDGTLWAREDTNFGEVVLWPDAKYRSRFVRVQAI